MNKARNARLRFVPPASRRQSLSSKSLKVLLASTLLLSSTLFAEEPWYEAYEKAQKAVASQNWPLAEQELRIALKQQPKSARRIRAYGSRFLFYIPDYYLAVVYFHQGRYQEAVNQFQSVQKAGVITPGDREFAQMMELSKLAQEKLTPSKPSVPSAEPKVVEKVPAPSPPEIVQKEKEPELLQQEKPRDEQVKTQQFSAAEKLESLLSALRIKVNRKRWVEAQRLAFQIEALDPKNAELQKLQATIDEGLKSVNVTELQRRALHAFYSGDYQQAVALFELISADRKDSPGVYFYLACSNASLGFTRGEQGKELLDKARQQFAQARRLGPQLQFDTRFISPRVIQLYQQTAK